MFEKRAKYVGNDVIFVGNGSNMLGNDLIIWQNILKYGKWLRDLGNGLNIWEMA